jgi:hypothetical protein
MQSGSESGRIHNKVVAFLALRGLTCRDGRKIVARWHNRCNSSHPYSNNVSESGVAPLLARRYAVILVVINLTLVNFSLTGLTASNITRKCPVPAGS